MKSLKIKNTQKIVKSPKSKNYLCNNKKKVSKKYVNVENTSEFLDSYLSSLKDNYFGKKLENYKLENKIENNKYSKFLDLHHCYYHISNPYIDNFGNILNKDLYDMHLQYCIAIFNDDYLIQNKICDMIIEDNFILPNPDYDILNKQELQELYNKINCENIKFIEWDFFRSCLSNKQFNYYSSKFYNFILYPNLNPFTLKKYKNENNIKFYELEDFKKIFNLFKPYFKVLQLQKEIIDNTDIDDSFVFNIVDNGKLCKKNSRYAEIINHIYISIEFLNKYNLFF